MTSSEVGGEPGGWLEKASTISSAGGSRCLCPPAKAKKVGAQRQQWEEGLGARATEGWLAGAFRWPRLREAPAAATRVLDQVVKCSVRWGWGKVGREAGRELSKQGRGS